MELTIEQALQQGVAAHKEGKLQEAERLYRAILQSQPAHPDANHNLGVLAVSVNKVDAALPLFKTALKANPKIEQFWLSYIDALIKTEKVDDARQAMADAKQVRIPTAKLQIFEMQLEFELSPSSQIPQQEISNPLHSHQGELSPAIGLREVGKYKEAQEWLSNVLEHDSKNSEALSLLSQVLLLDKKEADAERALTEAASINSELPSVYRNQARLLLKQSKTAEALEKAQLGCRQSPEDSESLLVLAACLGANQRDLEALPIIEKILKAKSNHAEAYANRALIKFRAKDTVGAIEDAKMTVSLKPHLTQMWQLLSSLHNQANNLSDAIEALRRAHKNEPKNTVFMIQLGEFLRQDNKASEAINILEQATELAPKDANAWTNLGVALQQEKKIADAKIAYEKALTLNPKSAAVMGNLGAMAMEAQEWESALQYIEKSLELEPNLAQAHSNLGATLKELGRLDEAEASYTQAIALKSDFAEAHNNLGVTLKELGRLEDAEASFNQAIALKPDYAEAHSNLGNTLKELGRLDEAEASFRRALNRKPDFLQAYNNLSFCYQAYIWANFSGKSEKINSLEEAIKLEKIKLKAKLKECPFWFVDVPRTSSKTISQMMWNQFGFPFGGRNQKMNGKLIETTSPLLQNHTHAFIAKHVIGDEIWKEIQTFTIVRNPYDWCSSLWHYCRENETPDVTHDTFLRFLDSLEFNLQTNIYNRKINHKSFLQTDYLLDEDGKILTKHVLPFEDREKIIRQLRAMGINYSPAIHVNKSKNSDYKMSGFERKRVEEIFAKDFEILGY